MALRVATKIKSNLLQNVSNKTRSFRLDLKPHVVIKKKNK